MDTIYTIETSYQIKYTTKQPVPIEEIIDSLVSLEKLLKRTPKFLEKHYKGIKILETQVTVSSIESGSLIEDFCIKYIFKGKDNYDNAKAVIDKMIEDNQVVKTIVAMGVGGMIAYGLVAATGESKPAIEAYNNTIINIGAEVDFKADDIALVLDSLPKKAIAREAVQAVRPAKGEKDATIEMGGNRHMTMPKQFIEQAPMHYEAPMPSEKSTTYDNIEVFIFASDRDNSDKGWAGVVPQLFEHRVKFSLSDSLDPKKLHGRTKARANVIVHEKFVKEKKKYEVKMVEITAVN
ncbi:hypothetical protein [Cellvibrio sp. PSBB023]|uniref:hypothetical protein n=1 Tax=Cellvibrio sp. PSBB023 TaxID=1945512 RepID=UPI00098F4F87|nr:hypothetical protein [Cellvibrio sp. PSBB023]AQT58706.1 hypothetical protein B0D95_00305 [Cellvibrio sp. PSBB023]